LDTIEKEITMVIDELKTSGPGEDEDEPEILLVIDQPDFLLAATGLSKGIGATEMGEWVMGLQQVCLRYV
jgi:elongator complex protein 6